MLKTASINTTCMSCFTEMPEMGVCPVCGYNESAQVESSPHLLRPRTILNGKYLLGKVLGEGGFGITYIAWDLTLDLKVAIKEFYPTGFVTRETTSTTTVTPFTGTQGDFFHKGREKFVDEAKTLAKFRSLPGIVTVNEFFIENNTAYIVMEYIEGETIKSYLTRQGGKILADQLFEMMKPVMVSLSEVHKKGLIHRDISPDNIMITNEGFIKLLDFGAAREFIDSGNKSMSIMLKPGFAPEEQYRSKGKQGPWTDVYALSATMYRIITGVTPDESPERMHSDEVKLPSALGIAIHPAQEAALMKGMAVLQQNRWQSVGELYNALYSAAPQPQYAPPPPPMPASVPPQSQYAPPPPLATQKKICRNCGCELANDSAFCMKCGTPYAAPPPPPIQPQYAPPPQQQLAIPATSGVKKVHTPSLVLMIVGIIGVLLFTPLTLVCSTIGLVMSVKKRREYKAVPIIATCIITLVIAVIITLYNISYYF